MTADGAACRRTMIGAVGDFGATASVAKDRHAAVREDGLGADLLCSCNDAFMDLTLVGPELNRRLLVVLARRFRTLRDLAQGD